MIPAMDGHLVSISFVCCLILAWLVSWLGCLLIVKSQALHGHLSIDHLEGVQKFHEGQVPRIGGVALFVALHLAWLLAPVDFAHFIQPLMLSAYPVFAVGVIEDLTRTVSVKMRLLAAFAGGLLVCVLTQISIRQVGVPWLDQALSIPLVSYLFTAFAVAGVVHAINIIDGFNGLAGSVVVCNTAVMAFLAFTSGDSLTAQLALLIACVTLGFLLVNYPHGRIFLGDGGAYLLGFLIAWCAIFLPHFTGGISSWSSLLILSYPVIEVLFSIARRLSRGQNPGHPDCLHLHTLIKLRVVRKRFASLSNTAKNALVAPHILVYVAVSQLLAVMFSGDKFLLILSFLGCAALYLCLYRALVRFKWPL